VNLNVKILYCSFTINICYIRKAIYIFKIIIRFKDVKFIKIIKKIDQKIVKYDQKVIRLVPHP